MAFTKTKGGRKSLKSKQNTPQIFYDDLFGNPLTISEELRKELDSQGLAARWIDYKQLADHGGYHKRGWVPYRRKKSDIIGNEEFHWGGGPDGLIRRGTVILGVKPKEERVKHQTFLRQKAARYRNFAKDKANELKKLGKQLDESFVVHEGYDSETDDKE